MAAKRQPWHPTPFTDQEAHAAKAFDKGEAEPSQQQVLRDWLIRASQMRDESFVHDSARATDYLLGRRSIGLQYAAMLTYRPRDKGE